MEFSFFVPSFCAEVIGIEREGKFNLLDNFGPSCVEKELKKNYQDDTHMHGVVCPHHSTRIHFNCAGILNISSMKIENF